MMNVKSIGIIGFGNFGTFIHKIITEKFPHINVKVFSRRYEIDNKKFFSLEETCNVDILVPCVSIAAFESVISQIKPLVGTHTIVCDVATVKKHTVDVLKNAGIKNYIATHPMFGPNSYKKKGNSLKGLRFVLSESTLSLEDKDALIVFLEKLELSVIELDPDTHDKLLAETLFLTHLVGQTIKRGDFKRTSIDTVSFGFLMDAVESVADDESLFKDVFTYNPYSKETLKRFESATQQVYKLLDFS